MGQSLVKIYVHAIFSTKHRVPSLDPEWRPELFAVLGGAVKKQDCVPLAVGGVADHVHMLFSVGRTSTIADVVGHTKLAATQWIRRTVSTEPSFHWQAGYGAFSVSQSNLNAVREYVLRQEHHHKSVSFQDELRDWMRRYEVEWDERYVWD